MVRIGIVAGEASGDLLGAGLIKELRSIFPDVYFEGIAGPKMVEQGCNAIYPSEKLSIFGLVEALRHYYELHQMREKIIMHFIDNPPDVFIGIDVPDFNLHLEDRLKQAGIKTVQYVSPQVWAWRSYRVKKIRRAVNLILALFPFEKKFYNQSHVPVEYVGHHMADAIDIQNDQVEARKLLNLSENSTVMAVLPGSRSSEVKHLSELFIQTILHVQNIKEDMQVIVPLASDKMKKIFCHAMQKHDVTNVTLIEGQARHAMQAADIVLLASGTATLEAMLLKRPMVVAYRFSFISYWVMRMFARIKYFSLPNLLANERVVPEFAQYDATVENLSAALLRYLDDTKLTQNLMQRFTDLHRSLKQDANKKAAQAIDVLIKKDVVDG